MTEVRVPPLDLEAPLEEIERALDEQRQSQTPSQGLRVHDYLHENAARWLRQLLAVVRNKSQRLVAAETERDEQFQRAEEAEAALAAAVEREQVTEERIAAMVTAATPVFQQVSRNHLLSDYEKTSNIIRVALSPTPPEAPK